MSYIYNGNCIQLNAKLVTEMVDNSEEIDYEDIRKEIPQKELRILFPDYDWNNQGGLQLHNDYSVKFCKSKYNGKKCLYIQWSAIEFVWVEV